MAVMKHIRIILFCALAIAGMSSCGVSRGTVTTARTLEIEIHIAQMPTVADLVVDSVLQSSDTAWTNTFKNLTSKNEMRRVMVGNILEKSEADVLIEPREIYTKTIHSPFKSDHKLRVVGYPARYRNFRTATEDDLRILNGLDPQPINYNTIYIGGGTDQRQTFGAAMTTKNAQTQTIEKKELAAPKYVRKKYHGTFEVGYSALFLEYSADPVMNGFNFTSNNLWLVGKKKVVGLGIGVQFNAFFSSVGVDDDIKDYKLYFVPIYFNSRFYFSRTKVAPFFELHYGLILGGSSWKSPYRSSSRSRSYSYGEEKKTSFLVGPYAAANFGMSFGKHVDFSFGTDFFNGFGPNDTAVAPTFGFKLGYVF